MDRYQITFETWNKIGSLYQEKFMDLDLYYDSYDVFCQQIGKSNPAILEIACGPGNITKYLLSKRPDFKIEAIDVAPNMIELAKKNNPAAKFKVMDCREIDKISDKFDAIICGFCLPYLSKKDCSKLIKDSFALLEGNGWIYFSTVEGDYQQSGYQTGHTGNKMYVYYHEVDYLRARLEENNFEGVEVIKKHFTKNDGTDEIHLIFMARKK